MNKAGPVIIIEDDEDDQQLITEIFAELQFTNKLYFFTDGHLALEFLISFPEKPFLILSDINLPKLNGMELRRKIRNNEALSMRCIPYLFLTTAASHQTVMEAYSESVQGFFEKPSTYGDLRRILNNIMRYWQDCEAPYSRALS